MQVYMYNELILNLKLNERNRVFNECLSDIEIIFYSIFFLERDWQWDFLVQYINRGDRKSSVGILYSLFFIIVFNF